VLQELGKGFSKKGLDRLNKIKAKTLPERQAPGGSVKPPKEPVVDIILPDSLMDDQLISAEEFTQGADVLYLLFVAHMGRWVDANTGQETDHKWPVPLALDPVLNPVLCAPAQIKPWQKLGLKRLHFCRKKFGYAWERLSTRQFNHPGNRLCKPWHASQG
jgi:hypothetical protein